MLLGQEAYPKYSNGSPAYSAIMYAPANNTDTIYSVNRHYILRTLLQLADIICAKRFRSSSRYSQAVSQALQRAAGTGIEGITTAALLY